MSKPKRILSFDIGLNNMGYSIVEKKKDKIIVHDLGLIDLNERPKCERCKNTGILYSFENLELIFCCKKHADQYEETKKVKPKTVQEIGKTVIKKLDELFEGDEFEEIIIENQPSFKNPKMKNIQIMIMIYFEMKNRNVTFVSPVSKSFGKKFEGKKKYRETKAFSSVLCDKLLDSETMKKVIYYKKCDDILDSILHGIAFLYGENIPKSIEQLVK